MNTEQTRRHFLQTTVTGALSFSALAAVLGRFSLRAAPASAFPAGKVRVGKVYLGNVHPGWPMSTMDLPAEVKAIEAELAKRAELFPEVEWVDGGLVGDDRQMPEVKAKLAGVDGVVAIHVAMGVGQRLRGLLELGVPVMLFAPPYSGHEWHTVASLQRQGQRIDVLPSSDWADVATAIRPFRAIRRLKDTRIVHVSTGDADAAYCAAIKEKFGVQVISLKLPDLEKAWREADEAEARADAARWIREAEKVVEPTDEEILKGSRMYVAMKRMLAEHGATAITMNCLGMGLVDRGMGYPCLGFVRFNNEGRAGVCEADLKSTVTQLIFTYLVGRTGFVTDPVFDLATSSIVHAHCVAATQMLGSDTVASPYVIRSHLEDGKGVSLQVRMPVGMKLSMARLIGTDLMLFSTGDATDSPMVDRACRTKVTMRVANPERFLENWSCGLHRVVFYGDHTADIRRFCRFMKIRVLREGEEDLHNVPGLEWEPYVHA